MQGLSSAAAAGPSSTAGSAAACPAEAAAAGAAGAAVVAAAPAGRQGRTAAPVQLRALSASNNSVAISFTRTTASKEDSQSTCDIDNMVWGSRLRGN
jgi:hypothetical protein